MIASGSWDHTVRIWDLGTDEYRVLKEHSGIVESVSFSPDGITLSSGSGDQTVRVWNLEGGECRVLERFESKFSDDLTTYYNNIEDEITRYNNR